MARTAEERELLLKKANEILEKKERLLVEAKAEEKVIKERLKTKYGLKTKAAIKKRLEELEKEHKRLVREGEEVLDKLEEGLEGFDDLS